MYTVPIPVHCTLYSIAGTPIYICLFKKSIY